MFVSFANQQINDYDSNTSKDMKCVNKTGKQNTNNNNGGLRSLGANFASTFSVHETKNNLKRQASMLMSLCRKKDNDSDRVSKVEQEKVDTIMSQTDSAKVNSKCRGFGAEQAAYRSQWTLDGAKNSVLLSDMLCRSTNIFKSNSMRTCSRLAKINVRNKPMRAPSFRENWAINEYCTPTHAYPPYKGKNPQIAKSRQRGQGTIQTKMHPIISGGAGGGKLKPTTYLHSSYQTTLPQTVPVSTGIVTAPSANINYRRLSMAPPQPPPNAIFRPHPLSSQSAVHIARRNSIHHSFGQHSGLPPSLPTHQPSNYHQSTHQPLPYKSKRTHRVDR